jgi:hypothetical protein
VKRYIAFVALLGAFLVCVYVLPASAYIFVSEEDRDPTSGYTDNGTFSYAKQTAHLEQDGHYTNIVHIHNYGALPGRQTVPHTPDDSDPWHPYTETWMDVKVGNNPWVYRDSDALVQW